MTRMHLVCLTLAATFVASTAVTARQAPQAPPSTQATPAAAPAQGGRGGAAVRSPEVAADGRVTFRLRAAGADDVAVAISGRRLAMQKDAQGVWSVTSDPMAPDIYSYSLVVDGATMNDPANRQVQTSFGGFQSLLVVPGPKPWLPAPNVARGAITRHTYRSTVAGDERDFYVYTPAGYDSRRQQPYPVLYLLHGLGDDAERWMTGGGGAHNIFDNLIASGSAVPMVVVTTLGYGTSQGPAGGRGAANMTGYSRTLLEEVMPRVDKAYHVGRNREQRAIAGLSMGGAETLYVGLNNLDTFAWVAAFSSAPLLWPASIDATAARDAASLPPVPAAATAGGRGGGGQPPVLTPDVFAKTFPNLSARDNGRIRMLWITCGTADSLIGQNRLFKDWLRSTGVNFTELEVPDVGHVWPFWRQNVAEMLPKLFKRG